MLSLPIHFVVAVTFAVAFAGCANGTAALTAPIEPAIGQEFRFVDEIDGREFIVTYKGIEERQGRTWFRFDENVIMPYPLEGFRYIDTQTGGLPESPSAHDDIYWDFAEPMMEWHHAPGEYTVRGPTEYYDVAVEDDSGVRRVEVVWFGMDNGKRTRVTNELAVTYEPGDVLPRWIERKGGHEDDGTWRWVSSLRRL